VIHCNLIQNIQTVWC